jgi:hypothetical protein
MAPEGEAARLAKRPTAIMRLTGLPVARFEALVAGAAPLLMEASNVCRNMRIVRPVLAQVFRVPGRRIVMAPEEVTPFF